MGCQRKNQLGTQIQNRKKESTGKEACCYLEYCCLECMVLLTAVFYGVRNMTESSSGIRIGFVSNGGRQEWGARYSLLDGQLFKNIYPSATDGQEVPYVIEIETKQGTISIELTDKNGTTVFSADEMEAGKYSVLLKGMVKVRITAEKHEGSFAIRAEE